MLGYHRQRILRLKEMINRLQDDPGDLDLLGAIQQTLLKEIIVTERKIKLHRRNFEEFRGKLRRCRLPKRSASKVKAKIRFAKNRTKQLQWLLYVWKAFGDAIPFIYLDRWSLKPLLYNHRTPNIKERPGFVDDKEGLPYEFSVLMDALAHGVPAVLTDLTNSIRHGDLCLLDDGDPVLVEVKSSRNENARTKRQAETLQLIADYFRADRGLNVRGAPVLERVEIPSPEVNHGECLNSLIVGAVKSGQAAGEPEPGLMYLAVSETGKVPLDLLGKVSEARVFHLNREKASASWMSYQPFTLLIREPEHLFAFLRGTLVLTVILDVEVLRKLVADRGWRLSILDSGGWSWAIERSTPSGEERLQISRHLERRIGLECMSLKWILQSDEHLLRYMETLEKGSDAVGT